MTVSRVCGCGAVLELDGDRLHCPSCGAAARWLVVLDGETVAAADPGEVYLRPMLAALLGITERN